MDYETPMTAIEDIEAQIKVLQSKLEFYKELEKTKTPCEEAYKRVYGNYPVTDIADTCWSGSTWTDFATGYNAAQKDYKVGEYQELVPVPEEEHKTLYDLIADWWDEIFMNNNEAAVTIESLVDDIEKWLPKEHDTNSYKWNQCIRTIKEKLR